MNRRDLLLAVLAAAGGQPYHPVQLQKAMFLVTTNMAGLVEDGPNFGFVPYDYGPFDAAVYHEAEQLQQQGLGQIGLSSNGRWRTYAASPVGVEAGNNLLQHLSAEQRDYISAVSQWVRRLSFASLVKSIYEAYPDMRANSIFQG